MNNSKKKKILISNIKKISDMDMDQIIRHRVAISLADIDRDMKNILYRACDEREKSIMGGKKMIVGNVGDIESYDAFFGG